MRDVPDTLLRGLRALEAAQVRRWWSALAAGERAECAEMFEPRDNGWGRDSGGVIELVGHIVDAETRRETRMFKQQLFDYIANHEEVRFFLEDRPYHICRAHRAARAVITQGLLPATFECPIDRKRCPMRRIVRAAGDRSVELRVRPGKALDAEGGTARVVAGGRGWG